jgi:hypothetical protein
MEAFSTGGHPHLELKGEVWAPTFLPGNDSSISIMCKTNLYYGLRLGLLTGINPPQTRPYPQLEYNCGLVNPSQPANLQIHPAPPRLCGFTGIEEFALKELLLLGRRGFRAR